MKNHADEEASVPACCPIGWVVGRAALPLSLAWVSQNTDFRTWRWNQYERHAEAFFLGTLRLDLVVTGVPANKPSSFRITRWGGSWLNSSSSIWSLSAWNDTARFT